MRVCSVESTTMVRAVPIASGLPEHSAAAAAAARTHKNPAAGILRIDPVPSCPLSARLLYRAILVRCKGRRVESRQTVNFRASRDENVTMARSRSEKAEIRQSVSAQPPLARANPKECEDRQNSERA